MIGQDFERWLAAYGTAWKQGDPDTLIALFAPDARYYETPFDPPFVGRDAIRDYWAKGARDAQTDVHFATEIVTVSDDVGVAYWRARFVRVPSRRRVSLDGVLKASFGADGLCTEFREWWHRRETA